MTKGYKTGGRTKDSRKPASDQARIQLYAKKFAKKAIDELATQMQNAPEKAVRVSAARELLDRAYGRPTQTLNADHSGSMSITVNLKGTDKDL